MIASNRAEGGTSAFFWQFVNGTHGTADHLKRVVPLGISLSTFDAFVPMLLAAFPAAFSFCFDSLISIAQRICLS